MTDTTAWSAGDAVEYFAAAEEYLAEPTWPYTVERPSGLWRRRGPKWQYLSLIDWNWHESSIKDYTSPPIANLHPITGARAAELEADKDGCDIGRIILTTTIGPKGRLRPLSFEGDEVLSGFVMNSSIATVNGFQWLALSSTSIRVVRSGFISSKSKQMKRKVYCE
ncbi:hypothetical protein [Nocardia camponoti]|nr:hypothetical protein [Nocardia camponoti]